MIYMIEQKKEIRILRIITRLNIGGPSIHVAYLSQFLNPHPHYYFKTMLVSGKTGPREGTYHLFETKNFDHIYLPSLQRELHPFKDLIAFFQILKIIFIFKPDIVHTHEAKAGLLGRCAAFFLRVPIKIHTFHGHTFHGYFSIWKSHFFLFFEKILSRISHIIVISPKQKKEIVFFLKSPPSLLLIPLGLPLHDLSEKPETLTLRQEFNIPDSAIVVGWVGRFVPIKNIFMILHIAKKIISQRNDVFFTLIGDGELRSRIEEWTSQEHLKDRILLLGFRSDLRNIYHSIDIATLTSLNEGTPVSLLEASACGKPVVATRVGGIEDIISHGHTGFLADIHDDFRFTNYLLQLIENEDLRRQLGHNARSTILDAYDISRLRGDIHSLYRQLIERA